MGNDGSSNFEYKNNREKAEYYKNIIKIREKNLTDKDLDFMNNSPMFDSDEMAVYYNYRIAPVKDYNHYDNVDKKFNENKKAFSKINLDDYKKSDGKYDVYRLERPLKGKDSIAGNILNSAVKKLHHEGVAIGNGKNFIIADYGRKGKDLDFEVKTSNNLNDWKNIKLEGTSSKSEKELEELFYGINNEKNWSDSYKYNFLKHNCQDFAEQIIKQLKDKQ